MLIPWTLFNSVKDNQPKFFQTDWTLFSSKFGQHKVVSHKESVPAFSMTVYKTGGTRGTDSIDYMSGAVLDFDGKHEQAKALKDVVPLLNGYSYIAYTTFSHDPQKPRFRLVLPFEGILLPEDYRRQFFPVLKGYFQEFLKSDLKELDAASANPSQIYNIPSTSNPASAEIVVRHGTFLNPEQFVKKEHARMALQRLSPDCSRPDWIRIGMALHEGLGAYEGFALWDQWSSTGKTYPGTKEMVQQWRSFERGEGITLGTLFYMADYSVGEGLTSTQIAVEQLSLSDQVLAFLKSTDRPCMPGEIAFGIGKKTDKEHGTVRNIIKRLYDSGKIIKFSNGTYDHGSCQNFGKSTINASHEVLRNSDLVLRNTQNGVTEVDLGVTEAQKSVTYQPDLWSNFREFGKFDLFDLSHSPLLESIYSFFTSNANPLLPHLALGATINCAGHLMRPVACCLGKRTNFYTLLICRTGGGKDSLVRHMEKFMDYQGLGAYMASNFVSVQGFEKTLIEYGGNMFMVTDEAAQWFGAFGGKNVSEHFKKLKTALKLTYSGDRYLCQVSKSESRKGVENPFVNASFLGTPTLFQNIREEDITDGLMGRMLVFYDENDHWGVDSSALRLGQNFIKPHLPVLKVPPKPHELYQKNDDCSLFYDALLNSMPAPSSLPDNYTQYLLARLPENFNKLLMLTLDEKGETSLASARWAASVAVYCYKTACSLLDKDFGKTFFSEALSKMESLIRSSGSLSKGQLRAKHAMQRLDKRLFEEALQALEEMGSVDIVEQKHPSGGRSIITIYYKEKEKEK